MNLAALWHFRDGSWTAQRLAKGVYLAPDPSEHGYTFEMTFRGGPMDGAVLVRTFPHRWTVPNWQFMAELNGEMWFLDYLGTSPRIRYGYKPIPGEKIPATYRYQGKHSAGDWGRKAAAVPEHLERDLDEDIRQAILSQRPQDFTYRREA